MNLTQAPKIALFGPQKPQTITKIRPTLRVRIEGNIENGNCYCIRIDYDDNTEEVNKKEEEEEEEEKDEEEEDEEKVQGTRRKLLSTTLILLRYNEV